MSMKAKYLFIGIALACALCACSRDEESLFDKSAAERAQEALTNANNVLIAPANGWEMLYFANPESRGYNIIMKFEKNGRVIATAKNSVTTGNKLKTDSASTWEVKLDYGPILTFDTYNEVFHAWSDPKDDGEGLGGDYEFLILSATTERVVLKGKKHSAYSILRPMPAMDYEEYFAGCANGISTYFGNGNIMTLQQGDKMYYLHNGSTGVFSVSEYGAKLEDENPSVYPICPTLDGFFVSYGFNDLKDERLFKLEEDHFVGEKGSIISAGALDLLFLTYIDVNVGWTADLTTSTGVFADAVQSFRSQLVSLTKDSNAKLNSIAITYSDTVFRYTGANILRIKYEYKSGSKKISPTADFAIKVSNVPESGKIVLEYDKPANSTASTWYQQASEMPKLVDAVMGTYSLTTEDKLNPTKNMSLVNDKSSIVVKGASNLK